MAGIGNIRSEPEMGENKKKINKTSPQKPGVRILGICQRDAETN